MLAILLLGDSITDVMMARYAVMTAAERSCIHGSNTTDVTVCGRRSADRFRVPFLTREPGDPAIVDVPLERATLVRRRPPIEEMGPFLVGGGMAGVHFSSRTGLGTGEARELAP